MALMFLRFSAKLLETTRNIRMSSKLEQIVVRLEPDLRQSLQRKADRDQRPLANLIRKILREHDAQTGVAA